MLQIDFPNRAIARTRDLRPEMRDKAARVLLLYADDPGSIIQLISEADLAEAEAEADRREFADCEKIRAIFARYKK